MSLDRPGNGFPLNHTKEEAEMPTCLFTNTELSAATREEHTIQRSLGGRIRSREVSSDRFNEECGGLIDTYIRDAYADRMAILGPPHRWLDCDPLGRFREMHFSAHPDAP